MAPVPVSKDHLRELLRRKIGAMKMDILDCKQNGDISHLCIRKIQSREKGDFFLTWVAPDPQVQVVPHFQLWEGEGC